jgi:hypothetical protein
LRQRFALSREEGDSTRHEFSLLSSGAGDNLAVDLGVYASATTVPALIYAAALLTAAKPAASKMPRR